MNNNNFKRYIDLLKEKILHIVIAAIFVLMLNNLIFAFLNQDVVKVHAISIPYFIGIVVACLAIIMPSLFVSILVERISNPNSILRKSLNVAWIPLLIMLLLNNISLKDCIQQYKTLNNYIEEIIKSKAKRNPYEKDIMYSNNDTMPNQHLETSK